MKTTVVTSELFPRRVNHCVPMRIADMTQAIATRDFPRFAEVTMRDSNQFHAVCLDTFPPAVYMNDVSHRIAALVHAFNAACGDTRLAYTFDAGANACLFLEEHNAGLVVALINHYFPKASEDYRGKPVEEVVLPLDLVRDIAMEPHAPGLIKGMIHSDVGNGPRVLGPEDALLDDDGLPMMLSC